MGKFDYEEGELQIVNRQCQICLHYDKNTKSGCKKLKEIPQKVLEDEVLCMYFEDRDRIPL